MYGRPPSSQDRKSTRLNSSHDDISYAVFCLKKCFASIRGRLVGTRRIPGTRLDRFLVSLPAAGMSLGGPSKRPYLVGRKILVVFFFNKTAPPRDLPFSPTRPPP